MHQKLKSEQKTLKRRGVLTLIIIRTEHKPVLTCKFKIGFLILLICLESGKILFN